MNDATATPSHQRAWGQHGRVIIQVRYNGDTVLCMLMFGQSFLTQLADAGNDGVQYHSP